MSKFQNLDSETNNTRNIKSLLKWKLGLYNGNDKSAPSRAVVPFVENDGSLLKGARRASLTWIGHATYLVQLGGMSLLTDPILSSRIVVIPRNVRPGLTYETLPPIDIVTITHNHRDHMDAPTLRRLGKDTAYVVPKGLAGWFLQSGRKRVYELGWWESVMLGEVRVTFVPSQHWSRRGVMDEDRSLWGGYVIEDGQHRVYHSGDTAYFSGFKEIGKRLGTIGAAMLPIGAYEPRWFMRGQHMNPEDAVRAFEDLGAERFVAMHWGTFKLTDEALDAPPPFLRRVYLEERRLDPAGLFVPAIGETIWI